jgi:hypothetical protein
MTYHMTGFSLRITALLIECSTVLSTVIPECGSCDYCCLLCYVRVEYIKSKLLFSVKS